MTGNRPPGKGGAVRRRSGRGVVPGLGLPAASVTEPGSRLLGTPARGIAAGVYSPVTPGVGGLGARTGLGKAAGVSPAGASAREDGMIRAMKISLKSPQDIEGMRVAGRLAGEVLQVVAPYVKPGVSTAELDRVCHDHIVKVQDAIPANLGYKGF